MQRIACYGNNTGTWYGARHHFGTRGVSKGQVLPFTLAPLDSAPTNEHSNLHNKQLDIELWILLTWNNVECDLPTFLEIEMASHVLPEATVVLRLPAVPRNWRSLL